MYLETLLGLRRSRDLMDGDVGGGDAVLNNL